MNWKKIAVAGLLIIVLVPVLVNIIMQIRLPWNIVYDGDWLGFFGAFFGAVFTVAGAIYVVHLNTKKENKRNYLLELIKFHNILYEYFEETESPILTYALLEINPDKYKENLSNFLNKEERYFDELYNKLNVLSVYNTSWEAIAKDLTNYFVKLNTLQLDIELNYLSFLEDLGNNDHSSKEIIDKKNKYDKIIEEAGITLIPYKNTHLEAFKESCEFLLLSETDKIRRSFRTE